MVVGEITLLAIVSTLFGIGFALGSSMKGKSLQDIGQNDITEQDCNALCNQLKARWNEYCLGQADEKSARAKWQQAAIAAAAAAAVALALSLASQAAASTLIGIPVAAALGVASVAAAAAAVVATGMASALFLKWLEAADVLASVRAAYYDARAQIQTTCNASGANDCINSLPSCS